jgi:hypothetical protein
MRQLYWIATDVLADFDKSATALLGAPPRSVREDAWIGPFLEESARRPDFYFSLPLMPDAMRLFDAVKHLQPIILTGLPRGNWAADQKMRWAASISRA